MERLKRIIRDSLFLLSVLVLLPFGTGMAAQQKDVNKKEQPAEEVSDDKKADEVPTAEKGYLYNPIGKTDPFKSFIAIREEKEKEEDKKPKTYLETLELSQLGLVIIVVGPSGKWAMVKDSKGVGHVIKEGTPIGTNGGVVYKIKEGEVIIREQFKDFRGLTQFRDIAKKTPAIR